MKSADLLFEGLCKRLDSRGVKNADLCAAGLLSRATTNEQGIIMFGDKPLDQVVNELHGDASAGGPADEGKKPKDVQADLNRLAAGNL